MDTYPSMTELLIHLRPRENYIFHIETRYNSSIKLFAPHGGCIEPCTGVIAREIAGDRLDYFIFQGIRKRNCFRDLHVTSTNYDESQCKEMATSAMLAVAIHGRDDEGSFIEIGGGNLELVSELQTHLDAKGYPVRPASYQRMGQDKRNFINLAQQKGVQIELSAGFRRILFLDYPRTLQPNPSLLQPFLHTMRLWLDSVQSRLA